MDLDSLKEKSRKVSAPQGKGSRHADESRGLIERLKEADEKERQSLRKARPFWMIATALFLVAFLAAIPMTSAPSTFVLRGMLVILYGYITFSVFRRIKGLDRIDYGEPVSAFLEKAEKRFAFGTWTTYVVAACITIFLAYGASFYIRDVLRRYFGVMDSLSAFAGTAVFLLGVYAFGLWATHKDWKKSKKELWLQIRQVKEELEREEPADPHEGLSMPGR